MSTVFGLDRTTIVLLLVLQSKSTLRKEVSLVFSNIKIPHANEEPTSYRIQECFYKSFF